MVLCKGLNSLFRKNIFVQSAYVNISFKIKKKKTHPPYSFVYFNRPAPRSGAGRPVGASCRQSNSNRRSSWLAPFKKRETAALPPSRTALYITQIHQIEKRRFLKKRGTHNTQTVLAHTRNHNSEMPKIKELSQKEPAEGTGISRSMISAA